MRRRNIVLAVVVLAVLAAALGPAAWAADPEGKSSGKQELLDPFSLRVLVLDDNATGGSALVVTPDRLTRLAIRIPERPALRSAFRPTY